MRRVHGDASMFIGGLRALLLQSLHPLAMAAVAGHSGFRGDPWGRLQRTSTFLAVTTFGTAEHAQEAVDRVRAVHERVRGRAPSGEPYHAADPHLLCWVHIAEVDSFLRAHQRYGARPLDGAGCDGYIHDMATVARALGVPDPPHDRAELAARIAAYRPELRATQEALDAARFILLHPPLPWPARPPYAVLAANAVAALPPWAREPLRLPRVPGVEEVCVRPAGKALTRTIRWAMNPPPHRPEAERYAPGGAPGARPSGCRARPVAGRWRGPYAGGPGREAPVARSGSTDVLVVGAGPVGLMLAAELRRAGVSCRIVDRLPARLPYAKAVGIQPRTLELFDRMGLVRDVLDAAVPMRGQLTYENGWRWAGSTWSCRPRCRTASPRCRSTRRNASWRSTSGSTARGSSARRSCWRSPRTRPG